MRSPTRSIESRHHGRPSHPKRAYRRIFVASSVDRERRTLLQIIRLCTPPPATAAEDPSGRDAERILAVPGREYRVAKAVLRWHATRSDRVAWFPAPIVSCAVGRPAHPPPPFTW